MQICDEIARLFSSDGSFSTTAAELRRLVATKSGRNYLDDGTLGGVGGRGQRRHLHSRQQDLQLRQLQLWQAHVWRGDGVERVLGDGGVAEGEEEGGGVADVEVVVEGED